MDEKDNKILKLENEIDELKERLSILGLRHDELYRVVELMTVLTKSENITLEKL